jgi:hypothetical protein
LSDTHGNDAGNRLIAERLHNLIRTHLIQTKTGELRI